jgi:CAAX prenyl protease-like protein
MPDRRGHGWWPYLLPIFGFLGLVEVAGRVPENVAPYLLPAKVVVPLGLFLYFVLGGRYPELRGFRASVGWIGLDVLVGIVGAAVWMAPYLASDRLRPGPEAAFDPEQLGASMVLLVLGLRAISYAVVTPFIEELFVRSWLLRFADVFDKKTDFRDVPIARFSWRSFLVVVVFFSLSHMPWEYPVAVLWIVGTQLWFYRRKHIVPLVIVHAVTNLTIFLCVVFASGRLRDSAGDALNLWFFL